MRLRRIAVSILIALALTTTARADYPDRPIKIICTYAAGGGGDLMVRFYAKALSDLIGQSVIVENKVGANGHLGNQAAMDAKPDGYTMMITGMSAWVGNPLLMKGAEYDPKTALQPITTLNELGLGVVVNPKLPINSIPELTAYIKSKNGKALYGSQTSSALVATNMYLQAIKAEATRVNYKSAGDAAADTTAGLIDFFFPDITLAMSQAAQNRVRLLASTPARKVSAAPNLQTMDQAGVPGFDYSVIWAAFFPKDTPAPIVQKMYGWLTEIGARPEMKKFLFDIGSDVRLSSSPEDMRKTIASEYEKWHGIVEAAKLQKE